MLRLPKTFQFSLKVTVICLVLAAVMIRCSFWQWDRYKKKVELVKTYENHETVLPTPLTAELLNGAGAKDLLNRTVSLRGRYDYEHEIISTNKKHGTGPGHWLITPFLIEGENRAILVSRGFIPFADREPSTWGKYKGPDSEELHGVLKAAISPLALGPKNPKTGEGEPFKHLWYYEEIGKMVTQLPYPAVADLYIQRLGDPVTGQFPAQAVSIEVPPTTHFGYTIEWALLAVGTLVIGFVLQAFPWYSWSRYGKAKDLDEPLKK